MRACSAVMQVMCTENVASLAILYGETGRTDRQVTITPHLHSVLATMAEGQAS